MHKGLASIAVGAAALTALVAPSAAYASPEGNGLSEKRTAKPEVRFEHVNTTFKYKKDEACRFPVAIKANVTIKHVITQNGDRVDERAYGKVKVTNLWNHDSIKLRIDDRSKIDVDHNDGIKGRSYGKSFFWGDDVTVHSHKQGHVSAANRGHQENEGIYYIQGKYKFSVTNVSDEDKSASKVYVKRGHVLDVCKALAGHHHHKKH